MAATIQAVGPFLRTRRTDREELDVWAHWPNGPFVVKCKPTRISTLAPTLTMPILTVCNSWTRSLEASSLQLHGNKKRAIALLLLILLSSAKKVVKSSLKPCIPWLKPKLKRAWDTRSVPGETQVHLVPISATPGCYWAFNPFHIHPTTGRKLWNYSAKLCPRCRQMP